MKSLFVGRFQPFHLGHLKLIQKACEEYNKVLIGIGSSQYSHILENPFTLDERKRMIEESLNTIHLINYNIICIPDIHNYPKWVDYVLSIISDFDVVISNNPIIKNLFSKKGFLIKETPLFDRNKYSGKEIRRRIINGEKWDNLVPEPVYEIIIEIDGINRLKKLSNKKN